MHVWCVERRAPPPHPTTSPHAALFSVLRGGRVSASHFISSPSASPILRAASNATCSCCHRALLLIVGSTITHVHFLGRYLRLSNKLLPCFSPFTRRGPTRSLYITGSKHRDLLLRSRATTQIKSSTHFLGYGSRERKPQHYFPLINRRGPYIIYSTIFMWRSSAFISRNMYSLD